MSELSESDVVLKESILDEFRNEFSCYCKDSPMTDEQLLHFVRYEGFKGAGPNGVIENALGLIFGGILVKEFGCEWHAYGSEGNRHFAVMHDNLKAPFRVSRFNWKEAKRHLPKTWVARLRKGSW